MREDSGVGIKPISIFGTKRLVRYAIRHAIESGRKTVTLVHKGNIQKFTEGAFREWGYEVATEEFREHTVTERESWILGNVDANPGISIEENAALIEPGLEFGNQAFRDALYAEIKGVLDTIGKTHGNGAWKSKILINDRIADSIFQQIIIRPADYSILAGPALPTPIFPAWPATSGSTPPRMVHIHFDGAGGNIGAGKWNDGSLRIARFWPTVLPSEWPTRWQPR